MLLQRFIISGIRVVRKNSLYEVNDTTVFCVNRGGCV